MLLEGAGTGLKAWVDGWAGDVKIVMWLLGTSCGVFIFGDGLCRDNKCLNLLECEMDREKKIYSSTVLGGLQMWRLLDAECEFRRCRL